MMVLLPVLAMFILVVLPDLYIYLHFIQHYPLIWRILWWLPLICLSVLGICHLAGWGSPFPFRAFFLLLACVALPKLIFFLISLLGKGLGLMAPKAFQLANYLALLVALTAFLAFIYGALWGWKKLGLQRQEFRFEQLPPSFDGYKIVQISDLHVGTFGQDSAYFKKLVQLVNEQNPDMIVFTGDIVNTNPKELDPFMNVFPGLKAKDGIFAIVGNHDYCRYASNPTRKLQDEMFREVIARERSFGWDVLLDEHRIVKRGSDSIAIVGVENVGKPPFPQRGNLKKARAGLPEGVFEILLSHDPTHWQMEVLPDTDIQLQLSGHTHGGQFEFFGWSPATLTYKEWDGHYQEGNQHLFISTGAGGNVPFRFGMWPEVVAITLKK